MGQPLGHCHEPGTLLASQRLLVDLFHHRSDEAGAVAEQHVGVSPLLLEDVAEDDLESWSSSQRLSEDLLIISCFHLSLVCIVDGFEIDGNILK